MTLGRVVCGLAWIGAVYGACSPDRNFTGAAPGSSGESGALGDGGGADAGGSGGEGAHAGEPAAAAGTSADGGSAAATGGSPSAGAPSQGGDGAGGEAVEPPSCTGVICDAPPANRCDSATEFRAYDTVGSCSEGVCSYSFHSVDCDCQGNGCVSDPCADVACTTPPAASCPAARTMRTYASTGTCADASCDYAHTDTPCASNQACTAGVCLLCKADQSCGASCVACSQSAPRCLTQGNASACVACVGDRDCSGGKKCNLTTHTCVVPSCDGLTTKCGPAAEDCCLAPTLPAGGVNRSNDPAAHADLSSFRLDKYEVTVGRFRKYVAQYTQTGTPEFGGKNPNDAASTGWQEAWNAFLPLDASALKTQLGSCDGVSGTWTSAAGANEDKPISCVSYHAAASFCAWDGGRLPTEAEWNYAAAGGDEQRVYPWSQPASATTIDATYAVYSPAAAPLAVGSKSATASHNARWGHTDMAGNLGEWVADYNSASYLMPCQDCEVHAPDPYRVYRGGSFQHPAASLTTTWRTFVEPLERPHIGFRCARPL